MPISESMVQDIVQEVMAKMQKSLHVWVLMRPEWEM